MIQTQPIRPIDGGRMASRRENMGIRSEKIRKATVLGMSSRGRLRRI